MCYQVILDLEKTCFGFYMIIKNKLKNGNYIWNNYTEMTEDKEKNIQKY